ncbi:glutamate-1-semialdehyde 2,1-aminomutase [Candidatus Magnetomonas plexicatena]|uniref:glutamate-1-semialdehyde 2,1-aminomutase n=1 Tax=Candidatus Magnetomonas plexicatena TaxID=2552947 RepID=UPI001C73E4DD|nr:glutamate-1-semialdehyde 2,1-aminomutase [Nitrospirales bacterium LBB_01]
MSTKKSKSLFKKAQTLISGGVNSPVRAFKAVGGDPLFISHAKGSKLTDVDGNSYIDYVLSWGPLILGHAPKKVIEAVTEAAAKGTSFGAPNPYEVTLAELIVAAYPSMDKVRFVNSGTEATMSAIRVARGFTKRDKIIKFEGCYHGHADGLLAKAGSGAATLGVPTSPGVPQSYAMNTITVPFNDITALKNVIEKEGENIACLILEPIVGNIGCVIPRDGFLAEIRELTQKHGIVLIFDEVMTGFRAAYGGAQELFNIKPDMTCLGKVIGGGLPVGAYGGKREIMSLISPEGPVYQAGTLSGNPVAMSAGIATLNIIRKSGFYEKLNETAKTLEYGLNDAAKKANSKVKIYRVGSMMCQYFTDKEVIDWPTAASCDTQKFANYFRGMLTGGIYLPPSQFEAFFLSAAHKKIDIERTVNMSYKVLKSIR